LRLYSKFKTYLMCWFNTWSTWIKRRCSWI